jgi:hypothetical protein
VIQRLDRITTWAILLIAVLYVAEAMQFRGSAKIVPMIFGGAAIVIVCVQLLSTWIKPFKALSGDLRIEDARDLEVFRDPAARRRLALICLSLIAVPLLVAVVGLPLSLPLYAAALLLITRQPIRVVLACSAVISAMSYGLLVELLAWPWDEGALWGLVW